MRDSRAQSSGLSPSTGAAANKSLHPDRRPHYGFSGRYVSPVAAAGELVVVRVRHDVVDVAVMPLEYGHYLPFRRQYPTGTCVAGNDEVRSSRDNGTSSHGRAARA